MIGPALSMERLRLLFGRCGMSRTDGEKNHGGRFVLEALSLGIPLLGCIGRDRHGHAGASWGRWLERKNPSHLREADFHDMQTGLRLQAEEDELHVAREVSCPPPSMLQTTLPAPNIRSSSHTFKEYIRNRYCEEGFSSTSCGSDRFCEDFLLAGIHM